MEWLWGLLLLAGVSTRESRPFALLLAVKWAINYATYLAGWPWAHMVVDLLLGTVLAVWAGSLPIRLWKDVLALGAMGTMVAHVFLVIAWLDTVGASGLHYWAVIGLFTLQAAAVATPRGRDIARRFIRNPDRRRRNMADSPVGDAARGRRRQDARR